MSGKLTAEQVRELIAPHLHAIPTFDFGNHGAVWRADFQAIADELNDALDCGECKNVGEPTDFCCSECGARLYIETTDGYTMIEADEKTLIKMPNYCPNCGRQVKR